MVADGDLYIYDIKQNAVKLDHKASLVSIPDQLMCTREAAKKVPPLMARPLRGGGGVKAGPLREKLFFILFPFKNKNYFTIDNLLDISR